MDAPPGLIHWHGPLTVLAAGLWLLAAAPGLRVLPTRGRATVAWMAGGVALILALLALRAAWAMGGHWAMLPGGWVHAGTIGIGLAIGAALWLAVRARPAGSAWAARCGAAFLLVAWCLPLPALVGLPDATAGRRRVLVGTVLLALLAGWWLSPALGQGIAAAALAWAAPRWRVPALGAALLALATLVVPESLP